MIKTTIKKIIGSGLRAAVLWPTGASCLAAVGYYCTPDEKFKSAAKLIDFSDDRLFASHANKARPHSMLGNDRLHVIYQCLNQSCDKDAVVVEVGCYKGGTSLFMASVLSETVDGRFELYACDTFEGHNERDIASQDNAHKSGYFSDADHEDVVALLKPYKQAKVLKGRFQDTSKVLGGKHASFIHLDTDLYEPTKYTLELFEGRMKDTGMVVVDDYGARSCEGVKKAVDAFVLKSTCRMLALPTGQAILFR